MKTKIFILLTVLFVSGSIVSAQIRPGVLGGVNFQNLNGKNITGDKLTNSLIVGFHAGVNVLIPIAPEINFQPGLLFSTKGALNKDATPDLKYKLNYLELPLNLVYRGQLGNNFVLIGFGPYLGYAINGNVMIGDEKRNVVFQNTVSSGDPLTTPYMRRFDAGANIFAGYELSSGLFFQLNTQLGLLKINPEDQRITGDKSSVKNTGYGLSVGFRF
jgi:hypothetical protein